MSYPADAFVRSTGEKASNGSLLYLRGYWVLAAQFDTPAQPKAKILILTGPEAGKIYGRHSDYGLCTAPGVTVEIRIPSPETAQADGSYPGPASLVIPEDGASQLWGHIAGAEQYRYGFTPNGEPVEKEEHEGRPFVQYTNYEVWLSRDGKLLSDKPLFVVGDLST